MLKTFGSVLALVATVASPMLSLAGDCHVRKRVSCAPSYVAPAYVAPVIHETPYVAPVLTQFVPIAIPTYSVTYAPGEPYASENLQLRQYIQQLQGQLQQTPGVLAPPAVQPSPSVPGVPAGASPSPVPSQGQTPPAGPPAPNTPADGARRMPLADPLVQPKRETAEKKGLALLNNRCAQCHTGNASKGGMVIFEAPGRMSLTFDRAKVIRAVHEDKMPPTGPKFTDEEYAQLVHDLGT